MSRPVPRRFTPTQQRMIDVLSDGLRHTRKELEACLDDELAETHSAVSVHLTAIRKILRPIGQDVILEYEGQNRTYYRHVRIVGLSS